MTDRIFEKSIDLMLAKAGEAAELAYLLYRVAEGDMTDGIYETLERYGYVDENHEWKYDEEDD